MKVKCPNCNIEQDINSTGAYMCEHCGLSYYDKDWQKGFNKLPRNKKTV